VLWFPIPNDTFRDPEDGDTSKLNLSFETFDDELSVAPNSWIQLNQRSRTLYGLPLHDDVGRHLYKLVAADSNSRFAKMAFEVYVSEESQLQRRLSHEFTVVLNHEYRPLFYKVTQFSLHSLVYLPAYLPANIIINVSNNDNTTIYNVVISAEEECMYCMYAFCIDSSFYHV